MADEKDQPRPNQLNIEISEEVADGIYSNLAIITHSNSEFVLDFVRVMPGVPKAKVKARMLLTPAARQAPHARIGRQRAEVRGRHTAPSAKGDAGDPDEFRRARKSSFPIHVKRPCLGY
jgi:hypothetical protein